MDWISKTLIEVWTYDTGGCVGKELAALCFCCLQWDKAPLPTEILQKEQINAPKVHTKVILRTTPQVACMTSQLLTF